MTVALEGGDQRLETETIAIEPGQASATVTLFRFFQDVVVRGISRRDYGLGLPDVKVEGFDGPGALLSGVRMLGVATRGTTSSPRS